MFGRLLVRARIVRHVEAGNADRAGCPGDLHQAVEHDSRRFDDLSVRSLRLCFEADAVDRAVDFRNAEHIGDEFAQVPHGTCRLDDLITVSGFPDNEASTDAFCINLFRGALYKAIGTSGASNFGSGDVEFIFYASQFRPNKNVITLLRAYEHLLKRRYIGHKLVLTGDPNSLPEIAQFIRDYNLQNDVLCLHDLSAQELAACYRLADLTVNPSLSEGGCPFTLTEALSVGTPVVMARIAVTEEVVTDLELQDVMLFDPYDWEDMAARIEWALQNKDGLLERQLKLYERLAERSWRTVVDEYIAILNRISSLSAPIE